MRTPTLITAALLALAAPNPGLSTDAFSHKPVFVDPGLGGWAAPLETLCFQAGCGELFYVAGVYLGEPKLFRLLSRSKISLREIDRREVSAFATRLAGVVAPTVEDLGRRGVVEHAVLTFYLTALSGNQRILEVYEANLPARDFGRRGDVPLQMVERRVEMLPPP